MSLKYYCTTCGQSSPTHARNCSNPVRMVDLRSPSPEHAAKRDRIEPNWLQREIVDDIRKRRGAKGWTEAKMLEALSLIHI